MHPLHEDEAGGESIVDFELAGSVDRADEILATWRAEGVIDDAKTIPAPRSSDSSAAVAGAAATRVAGMRRAARVAAA